MTWEEQKAEKRRREIERRERRDHWSALRGAAIKGALTAKLVYNRIVAANCGRTVTIGKNDYAVDGKGTYRRVAT